MEFEWIYHIGNSECTLATLREDSVALKEFMGNRVTECVEGTQEDEWFNTPTDRNISDLGTRRLATIGDLGPDTEWQKGPAYLRRPKGEWKITQEIIVQKIPPEEMKKKKQFIGVITSQPVLSDERLGRSYDFLVRVTARVLRITSGRSFNNVKSEDIRKAEIYLIRQNQLTVRELYESDKLKSLRPHTSPECIVVVGGRVQHKDRAMVRAT